MDTSSDRRIRDEIRQADAHSASFHVFPAVAPGAFWKLIEDTHLLNLALGLPRLQVKRIPLRPGVARRLLTTIEPEPVIYEEEHYQWEQGRWIAGRRAFKNGPLDKFVFLIALHSEGNGTKVEYFTGAWARSSEQKPTAKAIVCDLMPERVAAFTARVIVEPGRAAAQLQVPLAPDRVNEPLLRAAERALLDCGELPRAVALLVQTIKESPDHLLRSLQPKLLAEYWCENPSAVLQLFLRAARIRLLEPEWSVICPSCRGPKGNTSDVAMTTRPVHCEDCNVTFNADPTENLQLTFRPSPEARTLKEEWSCVAAPSRTPHVKAQAYAWPKERIVLTERVPTGEGPLRLRCPDLQLQTPLGSPEAGGWRLDATGFARLPEASSTLEILNLTPERVRIVLEEAELSSCVLRASEVISSPRFRELFASDQWEFLSVMERSWRASFDAQDAPSPLKVSDTSYDLAVIGSGPAGEAAALRAAQLGRRVALVEERGTFGGPSGLSSKAFRTTALKILGWSQGSASPGERIDDLFEERFPVFRQYVATLQNSEVLRRLGRAGVDLFHGKGSLAGEDRINIDRGGHREAVTLSADNILIATGSRPHRPSEIPFDGRYVLDASDMDDLKSLPRRLAIIGAGVIGCEYATLLASLGVKVTLLVTQGSMLPFLDSELVNALRKHLESTGVRIISAEASRMDVEPGATNPVNVQLASGDRLTVDQLLYALGRQANSDGLGFERLGLELGKYGRVKIDGQGRTSHPRVFAAGDIVGPPGLASTAAQQGQLTADALFGKGGTLSGSMKGFPTTLWTTPEIAAAGLTEQQARENGIDFVTGYGRYRDIPRGILDGDLNGWAKLVVERGTYRVIGVHIIGETACDLIQYGSALVRNATSAADVASECFSAITFHGLYTMAANDALAHVDTRDRETQVKRTTR